MPCTRRNDICLPATRKHRGEHTHARTQFQSYTLLCLTGFLFLGQVKESMGRNLQGRLKNPPLPHPHPGLCGACTLQYTSSLSLPPPRPLFNPSPLPLSIAVPCLTTLFLPPTRSGSNTISCLIKFCCV